MTTVGQRTICIMGYSGFVSRIEGDTAYLTGGEPILEFHTTREGNASLRSIKKVCKDGVQKDLQSERLVLVG